MEANNNIYLTNSLKKEGLTEVSLRKVITPRNENPTIFGDSVSQVSVKPVTNIPQSSFKREVSRVEQWINEWKKGMMRIEAGNY